MGARASALLLLASVLVAGCVSYATRIQVSDSRSGEARLSDAEIAQVTSAVADVATRFGLRSNPRLPELARTSEESEEYAHLVVADFVADRDGRTHGRVILTVGKEKKTGRFTVLIRDLDSFRSTAFTSSLEKEIVQALERQHPGAVEVERGAVGPDLGP